MILQSDERGFHPVLYFDASHNGGVRYMPALYWLDPLFKTVDGNNIKTDPISQLTLIMVS